jgi:aminoglycoside phosphotransferase (APT) family kinase protein
VTELDCTPLRKWLLSVDVGPRQYWILRRPPYGHVLSTAHDMNREHGVLSSLRETLVSVPRTMGLCSAPTVIGAQFYVMDNDRINPTRILGVLDWEMSTLGDSVTDLGILRSFWNHDGEFFNPITAGATALPGFPTRDELVQRYVSARSIDIRDIDWLPRLRRLQDRDHPGRDPRPPRSGTHRRQRLRRRR